MDAMVRRKYDRVAVLAFSLVVATCTADDGPTADGEPDAGAPSADGGLPPGGTAADGDETDEGPVAEVHRVGRFTEDDRFAWPGTSVRARFVGTGISIELEDSGSNRFDVFVDGKEQPVLVPSAGTHTYVLAERLENEEHEVVVTRRTESLFGVSAFHGFSGAEIVPSPGKARLVEFVGDSITAGFGVLSDNPDCGLDPVTEAETHAWGALAAAELDADHVAIAHSGKGIYKNGGGDSTNTMRDLYERILADDPSSAWGYDYAPDVVVVALGTNDFGQGDPGDGFIDAYVGFLEKLRERYPDSWLLVAESPMLSDAEPAGQMRRTVARAYFEDVVDARKSAGDTRVALVEIAEQLESDGYGCSFHPNEVTQRKMADALVARIRELVGW